MDLSPDECRAITAHASALGLSCDEYVRRAAIERAVAWQREQEAFRAIARRRGCTVEELLRRGSLSDSGL
ncbi:hypothetical protein ACFCYF_37640 [Streptomyces chartreusis]|uniref:hypothetical protein n=1 Tax=Streptomyces chartreusis TaxID=1969 RepID=UPI0035D5B868